MSEKDDKIKVTKKKTKRVNNLKRTKEGLPQILPKATKDALGRATLPETDEKLHLEREKNLELTEILMVKGYREYKFIGEQLGVCSLTAKRYVEAIEYRWAMKGSGMRKVLLRGKARARLDVITQELWSMYESSKSEITKMTALSRLMDAHNQQMVVDGLTPQVLVQISATDQSQTEDSYEESAERFQRLSRLAEKLSNYVDGSVVSNQ